LLRLDFHCHTVYSKDSLTSPEALLCVCRRKGIDRVVVTDHNTIQGALEAQKLDPERVIVGEEIMTEQGELLAAFVSEEVPRRLPALETIRRLREQGAFISVSHPFDFTRNGSWKLADLEEIAPLVDAIEVFNARCLRASFNRQAEAFASAHRLAGTAGSDGHAACEIGAAYLLMPEFEDALSLRRSLRQAQVVGRLSPPWAHFASVYARWRKAMSGKVSNPPLSSGKKSV
jgi:predicted metal-dependent phosphoesterase TrpH